MSIEPPFKSDRHDPVVFTVTVIVPPPPDDWTFPDEGKENHASKPTT